jgi:hypothetical protein
MNRINGQAGTKQTTRAKNAGAVSGNEECKPSFGLTALECGVARLLSQYEQGDMLAGEAAQAIIFWVLTHEGTNEALAKFRQIDCVQGAISPHLDNICYGILGLPRY